MSREPPIENGVETAARLVYRRTGRRGFLAKAGTLLVGLGAGTVATVATAPPAAAGGACCTGANCVDIGCGCPGISTCTAGCSWTGYTWTCCAAGRLTYCTDCRNNSSGQVRSCAYITHFTCGLQLPTATEISARTKVTHEPLA